MTWQFFIGSTDPDPKKFSRDNMVISMAVDPDKVLTMMEGLDEESLTEADQELVARLVDVNNVLPNKL